jgi:hypothetical protein
MGTSSSLTGSEAPDKQGFVGLQQERWDRGRSLGVSEGEPMMTEDPTETKACKQSSLSMVVVESAELGVEQGFGKASGVKEQRRTRAVAALISNQQRRAANYNLQPFTASLQRVKGLCYYR